MLKRRYFLKTMAGYGFLAALSGMSGCGFELRQPPEFQFKKLWVGGNTRIAAYVTQYLRDVGGDVELVSSPNEAQALLSIDDEESIEVVVGQTPTGQVREKQLRLSVTFRMWTSGKDSEATPEVLDQFRESSYSETLALAKSEEEALLYEDMRKGIARQLVWRLTALQP
ncbi:MAG: LPS assembly lipoprotein LptE [Saezia sp.]